LNFEGDVASKAGFFAAFDGLGLGESLTVEVEGVASGSANEILAFVVDVELEH